MSESLFSPSWHRVAELKPRLKSHARIHRHSYRGNRWYIVQDMISQRYHRLSAAAYGLVALFDGRRSVAKVWDRAAQNLGDEVPTQDEVIRLLAQLHGQDLLECDVPPDAAELLSRHRSRAEAGWKQRLLSPLAWRIPLLDPERWLARGLPLARLLFSWGGALAWAGLVGVALVLAAEHWPELRATAVTRALAVENLLALALVYPLVKLAHELGHAYATKAWGGEVHEMGITVLVLVPVPYVDASAASAFEDKRKRIAVGAAGVAVELALAAIALLVWLQVEAGLVRDLAFNVMLIGCVSTLLFNGNPLLRFDAYYVLADILEIPNLGPRSTRYIGYLVRRYLYGVRGAVSPVSARGERGWLLGYGVCAFIYRNLVLVAIIVFVCSKLLVIGVALALWAAATQVLLPLWRYLGYLLASPELERRRARALTVACALLAGVSLWAFRVPISQATHAEGVVWSPDQTEVRAGADALVVELLVREGSAVEPGQPLVRTDDPLLRARVAVLESRRRELDARYSALWPGDPVRAKLVEEQRGALAAELAELREQLAALVVRSAGRGRLIVPRGGDLIGHFVKRGDLLGYITGGPVTARVVVTQNQAGLVRGGVMAVEAVLADHETRSRRAAIRREVPAASDRLPSRALALSGGGLIPVDPQDEEQTRSLEPVFHFELELLDPPERTFIGQRVYVRFVHGEAPLAQQVGRALQQLLLRHFDV